MCIEFSNLMASFAQLEAYAVEFLIEDPNHR